MSAMLGNEGSIRTEVKRNHNTFQVKPKFGSDDSQEKQKVRIS